MPLIFLLVFLFSTAIAPAAYALDGNGVDGDPYLIATQKDLEDFRDIVNGTGDYSGAQNRSAHAKLTADINLNSESWTPIGNSSTRYIGTFDGGGYAIYNLNVNSTSNYAGFFGHVGTGGVVKNLTIASDGTVSASESNYVGGIVGRNTGTVQNCINSGTVSGRSYTGGIVGDNDTGTVENCVNSATVSGQIQVGGIVGYNYGSSSTVQNCVNLGNVSGTTNTGGIVGYNYGNGSTVQNCGYLKNENVNQNINSIGSGSGTNVDSFSSEDEMAQIAVTLSASIDKTDLALGSTDTATITLVPAPGTREKVYNVGVKNASESVTDNTNVIKIDNNNDGTFTVVPGTTEGTAEITVTADLYEYSFGSNSYSSTTKTTFTFKFYVSVSNVALQSISIPKTAEVQAGKTTTLAVTYTPENATNKTVTWESDNTVVATVDENTGVVTGVSVGEATITATPEDTSNGASAQTCTVTVTNTSTEPDEGGSPETDEPDSETKSLGSGSGCSAGTGALALLALIPFALRRKR